MTSFRKSKCSMVNGLIKAALASGLWVHEYGKTHGKLKHLSGRIVSYAMSPGDTRGHIQLAKKIKAVENGTSTWGQNPQLLKQHRAQYA